MASNLMRGAALLGVGIALGAGAAVFGPAIWRASRPAAKSALRAGLEGYSAVRVAAARMSEDIEDLVAEVAFEMAEAREGAGPPTSDETEASHGRATEAA